MNGGMAIIPKIIILGINIKAADPDPIGLSGPAQCHHHFKKLIIFFPFQNLTADSSRNAL